MKPQAHIMCKQERLNVCIILEVGKGIFGFTVNGPLPGKAVASDSSRSGKCFLSLTLTLSRPSLTPEKGIVTVPHAFLTIEIRTKPKLSTVFISVSCSSQHNNQTASEHIENTKFVSLPFIFYSRFRNILETLNSLTSVQSVDF